MKEIRATPWRYHFWDMVSREWTLMPPALDTGFKKGQEKGFKAGMERVRTGMKAGREAGKEEVLGHVVKKLQAMGLCEEQIALATGLSTEDAERERGRIISPEWSPV